MKEVAQTATNKSKTRVKVSPRDIVRIATLLQILRAVRRHQRLVKASKT